MAYRPQFVYPDPPEGWVEEDFVYYFDSTNLPALRNVLVSGQGINSLILPLQPDAPFKLRAVQISGNTSSLQVRFYDNFDQPLSEALIEADRVYSGDLNGTPPIGLLPVPIEPEAPCKAGGFLKMDLVIL